MGMTVQSLQSMGEYYAAYSAALSAVTQEQNYLVSVAASLGGTPASRAVARGAALRIGQHILELDALHVAIIDRYNKGINPPDSATIAQAEKLSARLATDVQNAVAAEAIVKLVTRFVSAWQEM